MTDSRIDASPGPAPAITRARHAVEPTARIDADPPALISSLRRLIWLRGLAIAGQAAAIALAVALGVALPLNPMLLVVAAEVAMNVYAAMRLRHGAAATHREVAAHLAFDLTAFTLLLVLAGGAANPFSLLYLLQVVLIALLLPIRLAVAGTLLVIASFGLAYALSEPLHDWWGELLPHSLVALGLWVSFTLTAAVTAWFISRMVADLRTHDRLLHEAARRELNDEALLRIGTLAAGAAHELGTPLMTMAVVAGEIAREADTPARERDAAILVAQIDACRRALGNMAAAAGHVRTPGGGRAPLDRFLAAIVSRFQATRPDVPLTARWDGSTPVPEIFADAALQQAILILLNNAADASPHYVEIVGHWDDDALRLSISDRGAGVDAASLGKLGRAFFTTKPQGKGTGMGLVLTASTLDRLGGNVRWSNRPEGGLVAELTLPLKGLLLTSENR
jgi:two-component system sensor histidine kinase RegB